MGLPAVGSERNDRHSPVIFQVPYLEIPEAITYGYRFFHLIRFYQDGFLVCIECGGCRMECPVGSGYFESFDTGPRTESVAGIVESDFSGITVDIHTAVGRIIGSNAVIAVGFVQCQIGQSVAYFPFLARMYLRLLERIDQIVGTDYAAVSDGSGGTELGFTQQSSANSFAIIVRSDLYQIERQFRQRSTIVFSRSV